MIFSLLAGFTGGAAAGAGTIGAMAMRQAVAEFKTYREANPSMFPSTGGHNDFEDAFRHTYVSARMTTLVGAVITEALGDLNELKTEVAYASGNPASELNMDLYNNAAGRRIGSALGENATMEAVLAATLQAANSGELIINPLDPRQADTSYFYVCVSTLNNLGTASYLGLRNTLIAAFDAVLGEPQGQGIFGSTDGENLTGTSSAESLYGFDGQDVLVGNGGADYLNGGQGSDVLYGGAQNDTYHWVKGDGNDTIFTGGGDDTLLLSSATPAFARDAIDLLVRSTSADGTLEVIRIKDWFTPGTTQNQLWSVVADGLAQTRYAITNDVLNVQGSNGADYIAGVSGYSDVINGNAGDDTIDVSQSGDVKASDEVHGGDGNDWIAAGNSNDFLYGDAGNDTLFGGEGANTYHWAAGDGLDTVYSSSATDTLAITSTAGLSSLTASRNGSDLLVGAAGAGGGGVTLKNWFLGYGRMDITLPDGTTWTAQQIEDAFKPAVMGVSFPSGVATANDFVGIVRNQGLEFAGGDNYLSSAFGFSWLGYVWQQGLQYAASTGNTVNGHAVREWGSSMGFTDSTYSYTHPNHAIWSEFTYQFWETDSGSYQFSLVRESAGTGGQTYNYRDTDGDGWTDTWDVVQRNYRINQSWTPSSYEVSPAVTQVDLLAGPSSGAAARSASIATPDELSAEMATAVYAKPVAVPEFLASPFEDQLFASEQESSDVLAYLVHAPGRSVAVAAELGDPSTFFGLAEDSGDGLAAYQRDIPLQGAVTDDASTDEAAYRDAQMVPVYISGPNDFRLAA